MRITVKVIPRAKIEKVEELLPGSFKVWVRPAPEKGRANARVIGLLSEYFDKPKNSITILQGQTKGYKIIEIVEL